MINRKDKMMIISRYMVIAVAMGALLSCNKSKENNFEEGDVPVKFATEFNETKGTVMGNLTARSIGIYGYDTGLDSWSDTSTPNMLDNVLLTYDNGAWVLPMKLYWPADTNIKYSFIAYAPYESRTNGVSPVKDDAVDAVYTCAGYPVINFEVLSDITNQTDFLIGEPQKDLNKTINKGVVDLNFSHVLTKVGFRAFCRTPGTTMRSLSISNLPYTGKITINTSKTWIIDDTKKRDFRMELNGQPISSNPAKPTDISSPNNFLFLLPNNLSVSSGVLLTVVYVERNVEKSKSIALTENLEMGKTFIYNLDFGGSTTEDLIITNVEITDWVVDDKVDLETK